MPIFNNILAGASGQTGGAPPAAYTISRSVRLNSADSAYFSRTPSSAGNRKTWTWSGWVKRSKLGGFQCLFAVSGTGDAFRFENSPSDTISLNNSGTSVLKTSGVFRDPSAWYHVVLAVDTTQSSNRVKIYVNGELQVQGNPYSLNEDTPFNNTVAHEIGRNPAATTRLLDGYLADVHFIDGQALAPTDFGEYDDNNNWNPKAYSGTYGTNGFHLDFSDNSRNAALGYDQKETVTLNPDGGMNVVTYTGNGSTQTISGFGFQPDFVWIKNRGATGNHTLWDVVRGANQRLMADTTDIESTRTGGLTEFTSDGFIHGNDGTGNTNNNTYVAWGWKAGGAASTLTAGSVDAQVSANTEYGFSVITATMPSTANLGCTVAHGLGSAPAMYIVKDRDLGINWGVYHQGLSSPSTKALQLSTTSAEFDATNYWKNTSPTSSVLSLGTSIVGEGNDFVVYAWSEVSGFSKFGSYTGNGSTNGPTVTTGFKPRFILVKNIDTATRWIIWDTERDDETLDKGLSPNLSDAEVTAFNAQVLSDGFQITDVEDTLNKSGDTFIYAAFADRPGNNFDVNNLVATVVDTSRLPGSPSYRESTSTNQSWDNSSSASSTSSAIGPDRIYWVDLGSSQTFNKVSFSVVASGQTANTNNNFVIYFNTASNGLGSAICNNCGITKEAVTSGETPGTITVEFSGFATQTGRYIGITNGYGAAGGTYTYSSFDVLLAGDPADLDSLIDTPTNYEADSGNNAGNYATMNPLDKDANCTLSNGNLDVSCSTSGWFGANATMQVIEGKTYFEATYISGSYVNIGLNTPNTGVGDVHTDGVHLQNDSGTWRVRNGSSTASISAVSANSVIGVAVDTSANTIQFFVNGSSVYSGTLNALHRVPMVYGYGTYSVKVNFGQRAFAYTPPTGSLPLVTTSLPDPTIADGSDYFDVLTWTGDGTGSRSFTGLAFQPDFTWAKIRTQAYTHTLFDAVRGAGSGKELQSDSTNAEGGASTNVSGYLSAFNSDGFSSTAGSSDNDYFNKTGNTYVAWNWDAGSSTVSNTDGTSLTNVNVRANQSAGFSIVSYTGGGGTGSFGHGLNAAPEFVILKNREELQHWTVYHKSLTLGNYLKFTGDAAIDYPMFNDAHPNSSVVYVGNDDQVSKNGIGYIAYCWTPVKGYSAFGSYEGNGSTNGPFVYTGFKTRWLMIKSSSNSGEDWLILDTARDTYNDGDSSALYASLSHADNSTSAITTDILSNGFKCIGTNAATNANGYTYIYAAFAEHPFKTARAR